MARRFHAIDATLSPRPRRLDGVEAHENHCLISTQRSHVVHVAVRLRRALAVRLEHADQDKDLELAVEGDVVPLLLGRAARDLCANQPVSRVLIWNAQFRRFLEYWGDQSTTSGALLRVVTPECPDTSTSSNQNKKLLEGATTFDLCTARNVAAVRQELVLAGHEGRALGDEAEEGGHGDAAVLDLGVAQPADRGLLADLCVAR